MTEYEIQQRLQWVRHILWRSLIRLVISVVIVICLHWFSFDVYVLYGLFCLVILIWMHALVKRSLNKESENTNINLRKVLISSKKKRKKKIPFFQVSRIAWRHLSTDSCTYFIGEHFFFFSSLLSFYYISFHSIDWCVFDF